MMFLLWLFYFMGLCQEGVEMGNVNIDVNDELAGKFYEFIRNFNNDLFCWLNEERPDYTRLEYKKARILKKEMQNVRKQLSAFIDQRLEGIDPGQDKRKCLPF